LYSKVFIGVKPPGLFNKYLCKVSVNTPISYLISIRDGQGMDNCPNWAIDMTSSEKRLPSGQACCPRSTGSPPCSSDGCWELIRAVFSFLIWITTLTSIRSVLTAEPHGHVESFFTDWFSSQ